MLTPVAVFFTYKANNDSVVFNADLYINMIHTIFGIRTKRNISKKEVIINDPDYTVDATRLEEISNKVARYSAEHNLLKAPNPIRVYFPGGDDQQIKNINAELEEVIEDLSNTKDNVILNELNNYPVMATHAHTRPFRNKWLNVATGITIPLGIFFYLRMCRFRLRLMRDLKAVLRTNSAIKERIGKMEAQADPSTGKNSKIN